MIGHPQKGQPVMIGRARKGIRSGFVGRLVLRSLVTSTFFLAVAIALSAASPSWAERIWSDAATVKASVAQSLFHAAYRHETSTNAGPDDYVQGLVRLGLIGPRS
jgi:hypothetical protein